jgi:hypothetical protein
MAGGSLIGSDTQLNQRSYYEASVQRPPVHPPLQARTRPMCWWSVAALRA